MSTPSSLTDDHRVVVRVCPQCGRSYRDPPRFCVNCGAELPPRPAEGSMAAWPTAPLPTDTDLPIRYAAVLGEPVPIRRARAQLGRALLEAHQAEEAEESLRAALEDPGPQPPRRDLLIALAYARFARGHGAAGAAALLDAVLEDPAIGHELADVLLGQADAALIEQRAEWLTGTWREGVLSRARDPHAVALAHVVAGIAWLLTGHFDDFRAEVRASAVASAPAQRLWATLVGAEGFANRVEQLIGVAGARLAVAVVLAATGSPDPALRAVDAALSQFTSEGGLDADAFELRAELRLARGQRTKAAEDLREAGKRFSWRNNDTAAWERSAYCLNRALDLLPDSAPTLWELAATERLLAIRPQFPFADETRLREAIGHWDQGRALAVPGVDDASAYWTRAALLEMLTPLEPRHTTRLRCDILDALERWLVLIGEGESAAATIALARIAEQAWRMELPKVATQAMAKSLRLRERVGGCEDWDEGLLQRQIVLAASLTPDRLADLFTEYARTPGADLAWLGGVRGWTGAIFEQLYEQALPGLQKSVEVLPDALWLGEDYALILLRLGHYDQGLAECARIVERTGPGGRCRGEEDLLARAAALCFTGRTDEAEQLLEELLADPSVTWPADLLAQLVVCAVRAGRHARAKAATDRLCDRPLTPALIAETCAALHVAAALLCRDGDDTGVEQWSREVAEQVRAAPPLLPASGPADALAELAQARERVRCLPGLDFPLRARAASLLLEVHGIEHPDGDGADAEAVVRARSALGLMLSGRRNEAVTELSAAHERLAQVPGARSAGLLTDHWRLLLPQSPKAVVYERAVLGRERALLTPYLGTGGMACLDRVLLERLATSLSATDLIDDPQPRIRLILGDALMPADAAYGWPHWSLFNTAIPRLRQSFFEETGVTIPAIRVSAGDRLTRWGYRIVLDRMLVEEGEVTGRDADAVDEAVTALRARLRAALPQYVTVDDTAKLLQKWAEAHEKPYAKTSAAVLDDPIDLARMTWILRGVAAAGCDLDHPAEVIAGWSVPCATASARQRLASVLAGLRGGEQQRGDTR